MNKKTTEIKITSEFITLGQFIKFVDIIHSGGEAKSYLKTANVTINGESDNRRGRKLRVNDVVEIEDKVFKII